VVEVYLFPAVIAWARRHRNRAAIILLDILLGWTLLGWVAAMVWAFIDNGGPAMKKLRNNV
jgi:uncharacterized membrane protein YqaE (UPF0057 family)